MYKTPNKFSDIIMISDGKLLAYGDMSKIIANKREMRKISS